MILDKEPIKIKCAVCGEEHEIYPIRSMYIAKPIQYFLATIDMCPHCNYVSFDTERLIPTVKHSPYFYMQTDIYKKIKYEYLPKDSLYDSELIRDNFVCRAWLFLYNHSSISYKIKYHKAAKAVRQFLDNISNARYKQVKQMIHNMTLALNDKPMRNSVSNYFFNADRHEYELCNFINSFTCLSDGKNEKFKHIDIPDFYKQKNEHKYFGMLLHNNIIMFFNKSDFKYIRFFNIRFYTLWEFSYFIDNYASTYKDYLKLYNKKHLKNTYNQFKLDLEENRSKIRKDYIDMLDKAD